MSPEKIALTIALGVVLGVTPVLGSTTLLCTAAALLLRLNLPAIQLVNGVTYPLQFVMLIPFYRLGAWMFRADVSSVSLQRVAGLIFRRLVVFGSVSLRRACLRLVGGGLIRILRLFGVVLGQRERNQSNRKQQHQWRNYPTLQTCRGHKD